MRSSWLYLAIRSVRLSEPVLICPQLVPTARSAMDVSAASPERSVGASLRQPESRYFRHLFHFRPVAGWGVIVGVVVGGFLADAQDAGVDSLGALRLEEGPLRVARDSGRLKFSRKYGGE